MFKKLRPLKFPLIILLFAGIFVLLEYTLKLPKQYDKVFEMTARLLVIVAGISLLKQFLFGMLARQERRHQGLLHYAGIMRGLIQAVVFALGLLVIFDTLGISITPIIASLGIGSLAVGLALQETLANFFAGVSLLFERPIERGHFIELAPNLRGYVEKITWRSTIIRMLENNLVVIPNKKVLESTLINYHRPEPEMTVVVNLRVHYDSDLDHVERVTIEVAKETMGIVEGGVTQFEPFIRYNGFDDFSIKFTAILRGKDFVSQYLITHEFMKRLHKRYKSEGIVIPYPIRTLIHENPNRAP